MSRFGKDQHVQIKRKLSNGFLQCHWALAKNVSGWGRIHTVERLAQTDEPEIELYLDHVESSDCLICDFYHVNSTKRFLNENDANWEAREELACIAHHAPPLG